MVPLIPAVLLLANRLFGGEVDRVLLTAVLAAAAVLALLAFAWLRWRRFRYRVEGGVLYIEHGLWVRRKSWIGKERVLSLDTTVSMYDRLFDLVRLEVETAAGDDEPEAVLSSISLEEAGRIQAVLGGGDVLGAASDEALGSDPQGAAPRWRMSLGRTFALSATSGKFATIWLVVAGGGLRLWNEWLEDRAIGETLHEFVHDIGLPSAIVLYALLAGLLAVGAAFFLECGFRLAKEDGTLIVERGLWEKKRRVVESRRIQAVLVTEQPLHRPFGMAAVRVVVAGSADEEKSTIDLLPFVRVAELPALFATFLPDFRLPSDWRPASRKAYGSYALLPAAAGSIAAAAAIAWLPTDWRWFALLLPALAWASGALQWRQAAWSQEGDLLAIRSGGFSRRQAMVRRRRVQWLRASQSPIQRGRGLATLRVAAAGASGAGLTIRHADAAKLRELSAWLTGHAADRPRSSRRESRAF